MDKTDFLSQIKSISSDIERKKLCPKKERNLIISFFILCRLDRLQAPTKNVVLDLINEYSDFDIPETWIFKNANNNLLFFNKDKNDLDKIYHSGYTKVLEEIENYVESFSSEVKKIFVGLDFISILREKSVQQDLIQILKEFLKLDFSLEKMSQEESSEIFSELLLYFSEQNANDDCTPLDVAKFASVMTLKNNIEKINSECCDIYDPACGVGNLLISAYEEIKKQKPETNINLFGTEIHGFWCAVTKCRLLLKNIDFSNIKHTSAFDRDDFTKFEFDIVLIDPPMGEVEKISSEQVDDSRFFDISVGSKINKQILFAHIAISKLKSNGFGIIFASSYFLSDQTKSADSTRKKLLEDDLVESIFSLPGNIYFSSSASIFGILISKKKNKNSKNEILLINGENDELKRKLKKGFGSKMFKLDEEKFNIFEDLIINFEDSKFSKKVHKNDFLFRKYSVINGAEKNDYELISESEDPDLFLKENILHIYPDAQLVKKDQSSKFNFVKYFQKNDEEITFDEILEKYDKDLNDIFVLSKCLKDF